MHYSYTTGGFYPADLRASYDAAGTWPADAVELTADEYTALRAGLDRGMRIAQGPDGRPVLVDPPPTAEQIVAQYTAAVQKHLDDFARTRGYDGILSAATYATSTVPKFKAEGQYAVEARDATWAKLYQILAEVEAGTRPAPSGYADIEPELPVLEWPA
jgi:hypothetical protein